MIRKALLLMLAVAFGLGLMTACGIISSDPSFAPSHPPEMGTGRPICSECHGEETLKGSSKTFASFDHTPAFSKEHKYLAGQSSETCASCHAPSFCSDCHGGKSVMSPSVKLGNRPDREMPHRGNYLTLHRMDGKVDPASCYKCHGRANNDRCTACHR
jgi:hypothetical protein